MLRIHVRTDRESRHLEHAAGALEFGRLPAGGDVPRCLIADGFVSRDQLRVEELANGEVRVENLSQKKALLLPDNSVIAPGGRRQLIPPVRLAVSESSTVIEIEAAREADDLAAAALATVARPLRAQPGARPFCLLQLGDSPTPEQVTQWLEVVVAVQRASAASPEFYQQTADALVELVGLDRGLVLLRQGEAWEVVGRGFREDGGPGREFSHTVLRRVVAERRTFYQSRLSPDAADSLHQVRAVVASPIFGAQDQVVGALYGSRVRSPARDVTPLEAQVVQLLASAVGAALTRLEQDARANELRVEAEAAREAARAKSQFLANMSHELRTPLTAILGFSDGLLELVEDEGVQALASDPKSVEWIDNIRKAGRHLLAVINDLLDLAKLEAGKMSLALRTFEVAPLVREVVATVTPLVEKNENVLRVGALDGLGELHADETRVKQVLLNLLSNACKFTRQGVIGLDAWRAASSGRDWLSFRVSDTGVGMTPAQLGKLFQPFEQVHDPQLQRGGTGLGLALCRRFCHLLGGDVSVESEAGRGSAFTVRLPAAPEQPTEVGSAG
jgi:signal transduction histidine kinase